MPEPVETRSSADGPSSGDLGDLIRLLIPNDPTTGPVPVPPPGPDTGPLLLPPIEGPFTPVTVEPATATGPATTTTYTSPMAVVRMDPQVATAEPGTAMPATDPGPPSSGDDASTGPAAEPDPFTVVAVVAPDRRRWAAARWARALVAWLLAWPVVLLRRLAAAGPTLRWTLAPDLTPKPQAPRRLRWFRERGWRRSPRWSRAPRPAIGPTWVRGGMDTVRSVYAVAFSPDARRLATASGDGTVRLWSVTDPTVPRLRWAARTKFAIGPAVAFSPDGAWLATGYDTRHAALWRIDGPSGPVTRALLDHPGGLTGLYFSADGRRLAATFAGASARVWDVTVPTRPRPLGHAGERREARAAAMFPDGRWLATVGERVELWDVSSVPLRRTHLSAGEGPLFDVAVAPDGRTLAVGRGDGAVDLWHTVDPAAPAPRGSVEAHAGWVTTVEFGPDGRWLATASAEQVALWDLTDPAEPIGRLRFDLPVTAVAFAPARGLLAVASLDGSVTLVRPAGPVEISPAEADAPVRLTDAAATVPWLRPEPSEDERAGRSRAVPPPDGRRDSETSAQGAAFAALTIWLGVALAVGPWVGLLLALVLLVPAVLGTLMVVFWWHAVLGGHRWVDDRPRAGPDNAATPGVRPDDRADVTEKR
jgi:WD40 repeat protein